MLVGLGMECAHIVPRAAVQHCPVRQGDEHTQADRNFWINSLNNTMVLDASIHHHFEFRIIAIHPVCHQDSETESLSYKY